MANPRWIRRYLAGDTFSDVYKMPTGAVVVGADGKLFSVVETDVEFAKGLVVEIADGLARISEQLTNLNAKAVALGALKDDLEDLIRRAETP